MAPHQRRKPTGRKPLPENLPRIRVEVLPEEVRREGRNAFEQIGEEVSEVIERRPASLVVVQLVRGKFRRKKGSEPASAAVNPSPTPILATAAETDSVIPAAGPILANSALDRLAHNAHQVVLEGQSYRATQRPSQGGGRGRGSGVARNPAPRRQRRS